MVPPVRFELTCRQASDLKSAVSTVPPRGLPGIVGAAYCQNKGYLRHAVSNSGLVTMPTVKLRKAAKKQRSEDTFKAVASRLGCDDDKARFEAKLGKIARAKPVSKRKS